MNLNRKKLLDGSYLYLDAKDYHSVEALSRTDISCLLESPSLFKKKRREKKEERLSEALFTGAVFHALCLRTPLFFTLNPYNERTKKWKEWIEKSKPLTTLTLENLELALGMKKALEQTPYWDLVRKNSPQNAEKSYFWEEEGHILCKARPDLVVEDKIWDLKTTRSNPNLFWMDIRRYSLDIQAAWYLRGTKIFEPVTSFRFLVIQKEYPFPVRVWEIGEEHLEVATQKIEKALDLFRKCSLENVWPNWSSKILVY